jgi:hypothetical protein
VKNWDFHSSAAKMRQAMKDIELAKARVADEWQDDKLRQLDEAYLEPLAPKIRGLLLAIAELSETLSRAERACGS